MTDTFKEIGSLFGREGAGAGFAKQTDKESFTYAFAWPEGDTWATLTGYLNLDEQPEEYVRRVLQDGGFRSDWGNPDYDPIGDFKETAGDEYRIPLLKVLLREQLESRYEVANHFSTMNRARVELSAFIQNEGGAPLPADALGTPEEQGIRAMLIATGEAPREVTLLPDKNGSTLKPLQGMRPERMTRTSDRTQSDKKLKDRMPHPIWERHLHKCEKEREVRMMKAEKGSEIITTICEYENSVAMPDNERLTYLDTCGIARLKDGNGNVKAQEAYANRCSEYLRFGHEVDLAACGAYSPYDALKVCDTPEIFLKTGFEQRPMLYTQKHLFQALTPKSDYNPHRHGFSIEQVKRFPELLASPVVLANSPTRDDVLLAILLATDAYDTPLIAGIKPDGTGNYGEREVETNMVLSVYSRQNFIRYFALLRDMDAFVFVSGRKIEALEDLSGLPLAENCSGLDIDRILQRPKCLG